MIPIAIVGGGALVVGGLGFLWHEHTKKSLPLNVKPPPHPPIIAVPPTRANPTPLPHPANATPDAPMPPPVSNPIKTPAGHVLVVLTPKNPETGAATQAATVATLGPATDAAHTLYDALMAHGYAGAGPAITSFQLAANSDPNSVQLHGPLVVNGRFDLPTSAALTIYTGLPFPPDPAAPTAMVSAAEAQAHPEQIDMTTPGPGAMAASNLYAYLKLHKNVNKTGKQFKKIDATLFDLVKSFQLAVNHDPKFPGPAYAYPKAAIIKKPLSEDGQYGKGTSDALAAVSFERINP